MKYKKLGDICDIKSGGTPSRRKKEYWDSGTIPWVKIGDIKGKYISNTSEFITEQGLNESSAKLFKKGTLLYTIFATLGEVAILDIDATTNQAIVGISHTNEVDTNYLYYFLKSKKEYVNDIGRGVAQNNINLSMLKDMDIYIPSLVIQNKIVDILDKAQQLIDKRKEQIEALDELVKSKFIEMFGDPVSNPMNWDKKRLADECNIITGNTPSRKVEAYYGDYIEWIKSDNITGAGVYLSTAREYLSKQGLKVGRSIEKDSILMTCIAGSIKCIGNVAIADRKVAFNQQINGIEPLKNNVYFMLQQFNLSQKYIQSTINMSLKGILSKGQLSELEFIFPPIEKQNEFAEFFKQVDKLKFEMEKSLKELEDNFNSLMQKAFKGELFN